MIARGRSMLQAKVDENCEVIRRLVSSVPTFIRSFFEKAENEAKEIALHSCDFDREVNATIFNSIYGQVHPDDEECMVNEFYRSMVLLVCSYAETTIKGLLSDPNERFKGNYLCCAFNKINKEKDLKLKKIGKYWKGRQDFIKKRNDIAHRRRDVDITKEELFEALEGAHKLLRTIADALEEKRRITSELSATVDTSE